MAVGHQSLKMRSDVTGELRLSNGVTIPLSDRTATMAALIGIYQKRLDEVDVGQLEVNFAHRQVTIKLRESFAQVDLADDAMLRALLKEGVLTAA